LPWLPHGKLYQSRLLLPAALLQLPGSSGGRWSRGAPAAAGHYLSRGTLARADRNPTSGTHLLLSELPLLFPRPVLQQHFLNE